MPTEYLATRTRPMFLIDVAAWQTTFLAPLHTVAKAMGGGTEPARSATGEPLPGKTVRTRLPSWHRKAVHANSSRGGTVWDLDNDPRARNSLIQTFEEAGNIAVKR